MGTLCSLLGAFSTYVLKSKNDPKTAGIPKGQVAVGPYREGSNRPPVRPKRNIKMSTEATPLVNRKARNRVDALPIIVLALVILFSIIWSMPRSTNVLLYKGSAKATPVLQGPVPHIAYQEGHNLHAMSSTSGTVQGEGLMAFIEKMKHFIRPRPNHPLGETKVLNLSTSQSDSIRKPAQFLSDLQAASRLNQTQHGNSDKLGDLAWLLRASSRQRSLEKQISALRAEAESVSTRREHLMQQLHHLVAAEDAVQGDAQDDGDDQLQLPSPSRQHASTATKPKLQKRMPHAPSKAAPHRSRPHAVRQPPLLVKPLARRPAQILSDSAQYVKICKGQGSGDCKVEYRPSSQRYRRADPSAGTSAAGLVRRQPFGSPPGSAKGAPKAPRAKGGGGPAGGAAGDAAEGAAGGNETDAASESDNATEAAQGEGAPPASQRYMLPDRIVPKQVRARRVERGGVGWGLPRGHPRGGRGRILAVGAAGRAGRGPRGHGVAFRAPTRIGAASAGPAGRRARHGVPPRTQPHRQYRPLAVPPSPQPHASTGGGTATGATGGPSEATAPPP